MSGVSRISSDELDSHRREQDEADSREAGSPEPSFVEAVLLEPHETPTAGGSPPSGGNRREPPLPKCTGIYKLHLQGKATLKVQGLAQSVRKPHNVKRSEWIASKLLSLEEELGYVFRFLNNQACSGCCCEHLNAGLASNGKILIYAWMNGTEAEQVSALEYSRRVCTLFYQILEDRHLIPIDGSPFPDEFEPTVTKVLRRVFRVYAHLFLSHFESIEKEQLTGHFRFIYKHFLFVVTEFNLLSQRDMAPLWQLNESMLQSYQDEMATLDAEVATQVGKIVTQDAEIALDSDQAELSPSTA